MKTYSRRNSRTGRSAQDTLPFADDRFVRYVRASDKDQKNSLEAQKHETQRFATAHGKTIEATFIDPGVSAATKSFMERPEAQKSIAYMKRHGITTLLVHKLDRAFRNTVDMHQTIDRLMGEGISFRFVNPDIDFTGPFGRLIASMLGAIAEFELGCRAERQKDGFEVMRRKRVSRSQFAPYGWELGAELPDLTHAGRPQRQLITNPVEQARLREIISLYEQKETLQRIADRLNADNVPTKRAGGTMNYKGRQITISGQWKPQTVKSVIDYAELAEESP